jgi:xeroderma pigmentosum group C-complementing protein
VPHQRREQIEEEELKMVEITEGMPTSVAGFKDHPVYAMLFAALASF